MAITIQIYERTGTAGSFEDELVTNMNWKSASLNDSLHKYYYYPVRLPQGSQHTNQSVTKYIYAKITGSYSLAKRVRWVIKGVADEHSRVLIGTADTFATPTASINGKLTTLPQDGKQVVLIPKLSTVSPTSGLALMPSLTSNTTYYTNFLVSQFILDKPASTVGNTNEYLVELVLDEYE